MTSASPFGITGEWTRSPKRTWLNTGPPRCDMPWISLFFTSRPARIAASERMLLARTTPCPPTPTIRTLNGSVIGPSHDGGDRDERTPFLLLLVPADLAQVLGLDHAHRDDGEEPDPGLPGEVVDRLLDDAPVGAVDDADVLVRDVERLGEVDVVEARGPLAPDALAAERVGLGAGHRRRRVVEDDVEPVPLVPAGVQQPGEPRVGEGGVADDRRHPRALGTLRQDGVHALRHRDARPHVHEGVHGAVRRQDAERVAADVAGDEHVALPQRGEDDAVRAAHAQP